MNENRFHLPLLTLCDHCGAPATHFCTACRKFLCDKVSCYLKSVARGVVAHPVIATRIVANRIRRL